MPAKSKHTSLLVEIARLYYEHNFSQQKIASKLGISRSGVSRLLQRARDSKKQITIVAGYLRR